ncbi:hypothetical protein OZ410_07170 [Robiginitalea sp. M366]|uniref:hypothetical protein n=1 Tax=Robiginitalea aestuariiviva TaxID=3036903 RepID=UPI00240D4C62|nr:hypothetical protein [Robiginitalea aestuariiviva]MDG1572091.1 hypothetical protein [Robiginitalea aestuariiviva]
MNLKHLTLTAFVCITGSAMAQFTGQIATNMSSGGAAQGATAGAISTLLGPVTDANAKRSFNLEEFQGSPYTSNTFKPTQLLYKEEDMGTVFYRYNALNEEIEIKQSLLEEGIRALGRDKNIAILVDGNPMSFKTFIDRNNNTLNGYLSVLAEGPNFTLYKRIRVKFTEGAPAANSFVKATPSRFAQFEEYYVQKAGVNRIDELDQRKGAIYRLDPARKDAIKAYLKENNLDVKDQADLVRIIQFLNQ